MAENHHPPTSVVQEFSIPAAAIERWIRIPQQQRISVALTRQDLDNLFFAITNITKANAHFQNCLILYSQGKLDEANRMMAEAQKLNIHGDNNIRMFMNAVMSAAQPIGDENGGG